MSALTPRELRCDTRGHMLAWRYQAEPPAYTPHCLHCGVILERAPDEEGRYQAARPAVDHLMTTMDPSTGATPWRLSRSTWFWLAVAVALVVITALALAGLL